MFLQHINYARNMKAILEDGYLRPGSKTGVATHYYEEGTAQVIFLRISTDFDRNDKHAHFFLDPNLLLETKFVMRCSWAGPYIFPTEKVLDGTNLNSTKIKRILTNFKKKCIKEAEYSGDGDVDSIHTNEILIFNDINLHKYLRIIRCTPKHCKYINTNYPDVISIPFGKRTSEHDKLIAGEIKIDKWFHKINYN